MSRIKTKITKKIKGRLRASGDLEAIAESTSDSNKSEGLAGESFSSKEGHKHSLQRVLAFLGTPTGYRCEPTVAARLYG